jgi:hypothetical protein
MEALLSYATALNADGFYFSFEFGSDDRIPSDFDLTLRCASAGLILACTGKPVLHAFAGPMSILSPGFGATGAGIGHSQNLWQFSRQRWAPPNKKQEGGPGAAPPRFYSAELCGTVVFPDEITLLDQAMQDKIWTESPFTAPAIDSGAPWGRWESNKHLVSVLCESVQAMATLGTARACARQSIEMLDRAVKLHEQISKVTSLKDKTNEYQKNWKAAMQNLLTEKSCDFDYLELIS